MIMGTMWVLIMIDPIHKKSQFLTAIEELDTKKAFSILKEKGLDRFLNSQEEISLFFPQNNSPLPERVFINYVKYRKERAIIEFLLEEGFPINVKPTTPQKVELKELSIEEKPNDWSPLFYLVEEYPHRKELVQYLVEKHKADVRAKTHFGYTVLMHAVRHNADMELIQYLIEKGADPLAKTNIGKNCFTIACEHSQQVEVINFFFQLAPDLDYNSQKGPLL